MHFKRATIWLLSVFTLAFVPAWTNASTVVSDPQSAFLTVSDLHLDPYLICNLKVQPCPLIEALRRAPISQWPAVFNKYDKSPIAFKHDSNYALFVTTLEEIKKQSKSQSAEFVLVMGDYLAHHFQERYLVYSSDKAGKEYAAFVKKTIDFITLQFSQAVPKKDIYFLLGNNDSYALDYDVTIQGNFYKNFAKSTAKFIHDPKARASYLAGFSYGGYYALSFPHRSKLKLIALNSVMWSSHAKGRNLARESAKQLTWMHQQLKAAHQQGMRVLLVMHIPAGIDVKSSLLKKPFNIIEFWRPKYALAFEQKIQHYARDLVGVFASHTHFEWLQSLQLGLGNTMLVSGTPAISPLFGNNPGFKIYKYSPNSLKLTGYSTYRYSMSDKKTWDVYTSLNKQESPKKDIHWNRYYWCAMYHINKKDYETCLTTSKD